MTDTQKSTTNQPPQTTEELAQATTQAESGQATEETKTKKRRRLIVWLSAGGLGVVICGLVVGLSLNASQFGAASDGDSLQATLSSGTTSSSSKEAGGTSSGSGASSGSSSSGSSSGAASNEGGITSSDDAPLSGSSSNRGDTAGDAKKRWHEPWDEQVWVDTSHWESVWVGDNPIYEYTAVCNDCGAVLGGAAAQHLEDTLHSSYSNNVPVQVGSTPVYENRWIESGYWNTVRHDGYWE